LCSVRRLISLNSISNPDIYPAKEQALNSTFKQPEG
jgi:hypothetical protein